MKEVFNRFWMPISGAGTSLSLKTMGNISTDMTKEITQVVIQHEPLWHYLIIGILGGIGGLAVKLAWCACKRAFPKMQKLDS